jgi:hypothetical protein
MLPNIVYLRQNTIEMPSKNYLIYNLDFNKIQLLNFLIQIERFHNSNHF